LVPEIKFYGRACMAGMEYARPGQMLDCNLLILFSAAMSQTALCLFSLSKGFFVGATTTIITIFTCFTQPSSRTF